MTVPIKWLEMCGSNGFGDVFPGHGPDCEVTVQTLSQEVVPADEHAALSLGISVGEPVNHRIVTLNEGESGRVLLYATSDTPLSHLEPSFKDDLMRAEIPIGWIMRMHRIELLWPDGLCHWRHRHAGHPPGSRAGDGRDRRVGASYPCPQPRG